MERTELGSESRPSSNETEVMGRRKKTATVPDGQHPSNFEATLPPIETNTDDSPDLINNILVRLAAVEASRSERNEKANQSRSRARKAAIRAQKSGGKRKSAKKSSGSAKKTSRHTSGKRATHSSSKKFF